MQIDSNRSSGLEATADPTVSLFLTFLFFSLACLGETLFHHKGQKKKKTGLMKYFSFLGRAVSLAAVRYDEQNRPRPGGYEKCTEYFGILRRVLKLRCRLAGGLREKKGGHGTTARQQDKVQQLTPVIVPTVTATLSKTALPAMLNSAPG